MWGGAHENSDFLLEKQEKHLDVCKKTGAQMLLLSLLIKKKSPDFCSSFLLAHRSNDAPVRSRGHSLNFLDVNEQPKENVNLCKQWIILERTKSCQIPLNMMGRDFILTWLKAEMSPQCKDDWKDISHRKPHKYNNMFYFTFYCWDCFDQLDYLMGWRLDSLYISNPQNPRRVSWDRLQPSVTSCWIKAVTKCQI